MGLPSPAVSVLWIVPLLCLTVGTVLVALALRDTTRSAVALREESTHLGEMRMALIALRDEADVARAHIQGLRTRGGTPPLDR